MEFTRRLGMFLVVSAITALFVMFLFLLFFEVSLVERLIYFVIFLLAILGLLFATVTIEREVLSVNPFKGLLAISGSSFALALIVMIESLQNLVAFFFFTLFAILFLSMVIRSYCLKLTYEKLGRKEVKVKELPLIDRIWIALFFCGFLVFLGLTTYYLGWPLA